MTNVKVDCALFPACDKTVHNKLQRAHYTSLAFFGEMLTRSAHPGHGFDSLNYRWKEKDVYYTPKWVLGPAMPFIFCIKGNEKRIVERITSVTNQMLLMFLKMMIHIPKKIGEMTRSVKQRSNHTKNYEDFMRVTYSLDVLSIMIL